jgi:transglutaminase-like putative cysteine protease
MMRYAVISLFIVAALPAWAEEAPHTPRERRFEFTYEASLSEIPAEAQVVDFWAPVPSDQADQSVQIVAAEFPAGTRINIDPVFGNRMLHIRWERPFPENPGIRIAYEVLRREIFVPQAKALIAGVPPKATPELQRYLGPNAMVPLEGKLSAIASDLDLNPEEPVKTGRKAYDYVVDLMTYDKTQPGWGRGDVLWACDSRTGNCSDFHSVFTGLTRTRDIPSYFEIGFPLPPDATEGEIAGYHCWAWFNGGEGAGWIPVDASEADKHPDLFEYYFGALTPDRVAFSKGRDLTLVPAQQGPPLNFFIYPYVEIDGVPGGVVEKAFSFRNLD